jgi:hypothetical protein
MRFAENRRVILEYRKANVNRRCTPIDVGLTQRLISETCAYQNWIDRFEGRSATHKTNSKKKDQTSRRQMFIDLTIILRWNGQWTQTFADSLKGGSWFSTTEQEFADGTGMVNGATTTMNSNSNKDWISVNLRNKFWNKWEGGCGWIQNFIVQNGAKSSDNLEECKIWLNSLRKENQGMADSLCDCEKCSYGEWKALVEEGKCLFSGRTMIDRKSVV